MTSRMLRRCAALAFGAAALLTACHHLGGGYAEPVNVPLSVHITLVGTPKTNCGKDTCFVYFKAVVTNEGDRPVFARDCRLDVLDGRGHTILHRRFGVTVGPGIYTEPGRAGQTTERVNARFAPRRYAHVKSIEGTCSAYVWHGSVPV